MTIKYTQVEDGELFKWDKVGKKIEGVYKRYKLQKTSKGDGHVYEIQTKDGLIPFFAPSLLHDKLQTIPQGKIVSIEFTETSKTGGGNDLKHFIVQHAEALEINLKALGIEIFKSDEQKADEDFAGMSKDEDKE